MNLLIKFVFGVAGLVLFCGWPSRVWAGYETGPYEYRGQSLRVSSDEAGVELTNRFRPGEKIYVWVKTNQLANTDRSNRARLLDLRGKPLVESKFERLSLTEYRAGLAVPGDRLEPVNLELDLRSKVNKRAGRGEVGVGEEGRRLAFGQFQAKVTLYAEGGENPVSLHISDQMQESYVSSPGGVVIARLKGGGQDLGKARVALNTFNRRGERLDQVVSRREGDVDELVVPMPSELVEGGWYFLSFDITDTGGERREYARFLVADSSEPTVEWQEPQTGQRVEGSIELKGTARADRLWKRQEYYRAKQAPEWKAIGEEGTESVTDGILDTWQVGGLKSGWYDLKLTAWSLSGKASEAVVKQVTLVRPLGKLRLTTAKKVQLPDHEVSTSDELSQGQLGSGQDWGVRVADNRSGDLPWTVTMTMSNLVEKTDDSLSIPVTKVTIEPGEVTAVDGGEVVGVSAGEKHVFTSETDAASLMRAAVGHKLAEYGQNVGIKLTIPANLPAGDYRGVAVVSIQ